MTIYQRISHWWKNEDFLIHESNKFRTSWDIFIIVLSLWICFLIPIDIAFQPQSLETIGYKAFNHVIDAIFILDVFFNFRTTISDFITGDE